jgi:hypothetical protein
VAGEGESELLDRFDADFAKANAVFFCVSVGSTLLWSPSRWAGANGPRSAVLTLMSRISWRASSR